MTAMEDRKKFTYRYDNETEKLFTEGLKKLNLSSLNKLIDKLIAYALYRFPQDQKEMKQKITKLQEGLKKCMDEKEQTEIHLNRLKATLKMEIENRETIIKLIQ
jgi:uncharacterized protein YukE